MLDREVQRFLDSKSFVVVVTDDKKLRTERVLTAGTGITITDAGAGGAVTISVNAAGVDHGGLGGLADDDHTQYALLAGRSGGQTLILDTGGSSGVVSLLTLRGKDAASNLHSYADIQVGIQNNTNGAEEGSIHLRESIAGTLTEIASIVAGQVRLPITGSGAGILIGGDVQLYRSAADVLTTPDTFQVAGGSGVQLQLSGDTEKRIQKVDSGASDQFLDIDIASGGSRQAILQLFRANSSTTGRKALIIHPGDGSYAENFAYNAATGQLALAVTGSGAGLLLGGDAHLYRGAADRLDIASGDNINWPSSAITAIPGSGNVPSLAAFAPNNGSQAAWLEVYINGTLSYIPYWQ